MCADITKCTGEGLINNIDIICPKRDACHRYTATAGAYRQSYFVNIPLTLHIDSGTFTGCEEFWPNMK